jgi:hypothetical protein
MSSNSQKINAVARDAQVPRGGSETTKAGANPFGFCLDAACAYISCVVKRLVEENLYDPFALACLFLRSEEYGGLVWGNSVEADWLDLVGPLHTHDYPAVDDEEWQAVFQSHSPSPSQVPSLPNSTYPPFSPYDWLCDDGPESLAELQEMLLGLCADSSFPKPERSGIHDLQNIWFEAIKSRINELFESIDMGGLFSPMVLFQNAEGNRHIVPIIRLIPARPIKANGEKGPRPHHRTVFTRENAFKLFKACEGIERRHLNASPRYQEVLRRRKEQAAGGAAPSRKAQNAAVAGKMGKSHITNISMLRTSKRTPIDKISSLENRISKQQQLLSEMPEDAVERIDALLLLQNLKDELMAAQQAVEAAQQGPHESVFLIHNWTAGSEETQNGKPMSLKEIMAQQAAQKGEVMTHIKTIAGLAAKEAQAPQSSQRMGCLMPSNFQCARTRSQDPSKGFLMRSERSVDPSANYVSSGEWRRAQITAAMAAPAAASVVEEAAAAPAPARDERVWRIFEQVHNEVQEDLDAPVLDVTEPRQQAPGPKKTKKSGKLTGNQRAAKKAAAAGEVPICRNVSKPEGCKHGANCRFRHPETEKVTGAISAPCAAAAAGSTTEVLCQNISMSYSTASAVAEAIPAKPAPAPPSVLDILANSSKLNTAIGGISFSTGSSPMDLAGPIAAHLRTNLHKQGAGRI